MDNAFERARAAYGTGAYDDATLEFLFPQLKESEDERVRRHLIDIVETYWGKTNDPGKAADLAWLEKQKELFESGKGLYYYDGEKTTYCGYPATEENPYDFAMSQQEKQKEQKPAEWSEEDEDMLNSCISSIEEAKENRYTYKETDGDTSYDHEIAWLKSLRPQWRPSEEQMSMLLAVINDPNNAGAESCYMALKSIYNNLKKLM